MSGSKNLLELRSPHRVTPEVAKHLQEALKPLLESTNCEVIITDPSFEVTLHPVQLHNSIEKLCTVIEGFTQTNQQLVEVNQALLAYMIDLDGGAPESEMGQSLDG